LPSDTIASIRTEGLLGESYVLLRPGGAEDDLAAGDRIAQTEPAIDLIDLIVKYALESGEDERGGRARPATPALPGPVRVRRLSMLTVLIALFLAASPAPIDEVQASAARRRRSDHGRGGAGAIALTRARGRPAGAGRQSRRSTAERAGELEAKRASGDR
jgi:hypothetical protein